MELIRTEEMVFLKELRKTNLIRKLYCLLLMLRSYQIMSGYYFFECNTANTPIDRWVFSAIFSALLMLLFFTNNWLVPLLIALLQAKFDAYFNTSTIGSTITVYINLYFAAYYFSLQKLNRTDNKDFGEFNLKTKHYKYLLAVLWGILNLYSLVAHFKDAHWADGSAFGIMLCNPFISPHFEWFRSLSLSAPQAYWNISKMASYFFVFSQLAMLPLFLIKKTRFSLYFFMLVYLICITFIVDVSFLAHFAWLLFFIVLPQFKISRNKIFIQKDPTLFSNKSPKLNKIFFSVIGLFMLMNTPVIDKAIKKPIWFLQEWDTYQYLNNKLAMMGLGKADLFNSYILDGGKKWFVIYKQENNVWKQVPIMDTNGRKSSYHTDWLHTTNHGSDFLWLANTYQYAIGREYIDYSTYIHIRLIRFDFNKYSSQPSMDYKVCFYSEKTKEENPFYTTMDSCLFYSCPKNKPVERISAAGEKPVR